jgi:hypothetical protein
MPFVRHDYVVQAFSANTSDNPFRIAVLPRTPGRYRNLFNTQSINSCCEIMTIDPITISYQVARHCVVRKRFHDLLSSPGGCRVFRDIEMQNSATVVRQDDENIKHAELYGRNREEVDRNHLADVISKKRHPGLRWLSPLLGHEARHRPFGNLESQFLQFPRVPVALPMSDWRLPWRGSLSGSPNGSADDPVVSVGITSTKTV